MRHPSAAVHRYRPGLAGWGGTGVIAGAPEIFARSRIAGPSRIVGTLAPAPPPTRQGKEVKTPSDPVSDSTVYAGRPPVRSVGMRAETRLLTVRESLHYSQKVVKRHFSWRAGFGDPDRYTPRAARVGPIGLRYRTIVRLAYHHPGAPRTPRKPRTQGVSACRRSSVRSYRFRSSTE